MNETSKHKNNKLAISFPEILVAVLVFSILAFPIYSLLSQTRKDTLKTINYLRAMELAQEGLDWVKMTPIKNNFSRTVENYSGSLVVENGKAFSPLILSMATNPWYANSLITQIPYSEQYNSAWFYRLITVENVSTANPYSKLLKKVTVAVYWNNAKKAKNLYNKNGRDKLVILKTLILDGNKQI